MVGRTMDVRLGGQQPSGGTMDGLEREVKPIPLPAPGGMLIYPIHAPPSTAIEPARPVVLHQPRP